MVLIAPRQYGYLRKAYVLEVPKIAWASLDMTFKGHDDDLKVVNSAAVEREKAGTTQQRGGESD